MAPARPYQYIDLGADEVVGRRRTFKDNGFIAVRDSPDVVIEYQYIEEVRAPRQQYKFLDVGAEELRGTFAYPAHSEELLLYDAHSHMRARPERPFYSARYLLPQEDERAAQRRAAKAAALAEFTAEPPDALPPTGPSARRDPTMQERGPPPGTPPAAVVPSVPPSGPVWGSPSGTGAAADWPPATEAMTPERPPPQPMQPPPAPARPPRPPRPPPPDENGSGLDASDVEERIRAAGRVPPTPTPSPSEPSPLQAGGVPFSGAGPRAHRLFDDDLEPEAVVEERTAYSGPIPVPSYIPEPTILKEAPSGRLKRQRVSQEEDQFEGTYETHEEITFYRDGAPMSPSAQPTPGRAPQRSGFAWIDPWSDEATVDRVGPPSQPLVPPAADRRPNVYRRPQAPGGGSWIDRKADEVVVDRMAPHQRPTARTAAARQPPPRRYTYIEDEEEEPVKKPALPGASAVQPPVVPQRTPVSALRPGASLAPTAERSTVELAVEEAVVTGVVAPDSAGGPLAGGAVAMTETTVLAIQETGEAPAAAAEPGAVAAAEESALESALEVEVTPEEGDKKIRKRAVPPLPFLPRTPLHEPQPGKTPLPFVPKTPQPVPSPGPTPTTAPPDAGAAPAGASVRADRMKSNLRDTGPSLLPFVPRARGPEGPPARKEPERAAVFEPPPAAPRPRRRMTLLPFIPTAPAGPSAAALPPPAEAPGEPRPSAGQRLKRMFSRKKESRAQPDVNVLPAPVLVPPTSVPPAPEAPPPQPVEPHVERPRAAEAVVSVERPPPPQPSVVPSLSPEPVGVPPAVAAEVTAVEFEEEEAAVAEEGLPPVEAQPEGEEFAVPEVQEEPGYILVSLPATPEKAAPGEATRGESAAESAAAEPEQAARGESAPAQQARSASEPVVYAAAIPAAPILAEPVKAMQLPKAESAAPQKMPSAGEEGVSTEAPVKAKEGRVMETRRAAAAPVPPAPSKPEERPSDNEVTAPAPTTEEVAEAERMAAAQRALKEYEVALVGDEVTAEAPKPGSATRQPDPMQLQVEAPAFEQGPEAPGGTLHEKLAAQRDQTDEQRFKDDRMPLHEVCWGGPVAYQALVVSTPAGIGAGHVIEAAEEAEGHLQHGKPIPLHMPPKEDTAIKTIVQRKEESMERQAADDHAQKPDQVAAGMPAQTAQGTAQAGAPQQQESSSWPMFQEMPAPRARQASAAADQEPAAGGQEAAEEANNWPSIEPMETLESARATPEPPSQQRGILDSGRDFVEPVQYEAAAAAAGSAPTSEADFPDFRSPVGSFTGGTGVMDTFTSDTAFFDASEQIEAPAPDVPCSAAAPQERQLSQATKSPSYAEELSPEERGLLRSQELTEMRDRAQAEASPEDRGVLRSDELTDLRGRAAASEPELSPEERGLMRSQELTEMRDRQSRLAQPVAAERAAETAPPQPHQPPPQPEPVPKPSSGSSTLWPQGFTQGMEEDEMRSRERLAAMAERSKTSLEETQEKVVALAAQGRTSIEESRSRGLERLAALAQQHPKPGRSEGESMGTAEARQRFVDLEQQGPTSASSIPVPKDPALGKAPSVSSDGLAAPAVRGPISPARTPRSSLPKARSSSLPELSSQHTLKTAPVTPADWAEAKGKGAAQPETPGVGPSGLHSPFGAASEDPPKSSQQSELTTEGGARPPLSPDTAESEAASSRGQVIITSPKRGNAEKKQGSTFKKFKQMFGGKDKEAQEEKEAAPSSSSGP